MIFAKQGQRIAVFVVQRQPGEFFVGNIGGRCKAEAGKIGGEGNFITRGDGQAVFFGAYGVKIGGEFRSVVYLRRNNEEVALQMVNSVSIGSDAENIGAGSLGRLQDGAQRGGNEQGGIVGED